MKSEMNNNIQLRKIILKQKYYLSKWIIIIFLLKLISINTILDNKTRNLINFDSEIRLVVQGSGKQYFLSANYGGIQPFQIILNGEEEIENPSDLGEDRNNITLKFNEKIKDCEGMFSYLDNILEIDLSNFDMSMVTNMISMFDSCPNLEYVNLTNLTTSSVSNLDYLFYECSNLKSIDLSNLDFSKVIRMPSIFYRCTNLVKVNLTNLKIPSVENMKYFFYGCSSLESIDLSTLDFSKGSIIKSSLRDVSSLFADCSSLKSIDLSTLDFSKVTEMIRMFRGCSNLENINLTNLNTSSLNDTSFLFYGCVNLKSIDLSHLDFSKVISIRGMFYNCYNLENMNLTNLNTSSVRDLSYVFSGCQTLRYLNLSSFDTSKVTDMSYMFYNCKSLLYLDLSNFKTANVAIINYMFYNCESLIYLNMYYFKLNNTVTGNTSFLFLPSYTNYCIKDTDTANNILGPNISDCSHFCFQKNKKIDLIHNTCVDLCIRNKIIYEYNNICYNKCPKGTLVNDAICEDINCGENNYESTECLSKIPKGYYYDPKEELFKKCYYSCKTCNGKGRKSYHNCLECLPDLTFLNDSMYATNCYKKCDYYFYIDEINNYHCTKNYECPELYNKLILDKKKCLDKCKNDDIYQYEYENRCILSCPNGTFYEERDRICLKKELITSTAIYKNKQTKKIEETIKENEIATTYLNTTINNKTDEILIKEETSTYLDNSFNKNIKIFRNYIKDFNISKDKEDKIEIIDGILYQITTTENRKIKNISTSYFPICESILKDIYKIDKNIPLIILKLDYFPQDSLIPIIGYEIYHPFNKSKLNLKYCNNTEIKFNIPVSIDDSKLYIYEPNSDYYTDDCFAYSTEKGTDIILNDRKQEFIDKKLYLCENDCNYTGYDKINKQSICICNIANKIELISEIINNPNKLSNNSKSNFVKYSYSNINAMKCFKALFSKKGLKKNISSYLIILFIIQFIVSTILFFKYGYYLLEDDINHILEIKEANEKNERNIYENNENVTEGNLSYKNKNLSKHKNDLPRKINILNTNNKNKFKNQIIDNSYDFKSVIKLNSSKINQEDYKSDKNEKSIILDNIITIKKNTPIIDNKEKFNKYIELNSSSYEDAIKNDNRTIFEYYLFLIERKNIILYSFYPMNDYNSMIIKSCIFSLSFSLNYLINLAFFNEEIIHKIYKLYVKYDVKNFISKILISFIISYIITRIIQYIVLSERYVFQIKKEISLSTAKDLSEKVKKKLFLKYILFFIFSFILLIFCWLFLVSFSAVYQNTQIILLYNTLISFAMCICYTLIYNIFPAIERINSLKLKRKHRYQLSKLLQIL